MRRIRRNHPATDTASAGDEIELIHSDGWQGGCRRKRSSTWWLDVTREQEIGLRSNRLLRLTLLTALIGIVAVLVCRHEGWTAGLPWLLALVTAALGLYGTLSCIVARLVLHKGLTTPPSAVSRSQHETDRTTDYQRLALTRLGAVLAEHGLDDTHFNVVTNGLEWLVAVFAWKGRAYEIEIYADSVVMLSGKQLFEIFMANEFGSAEIEIESFARRLDRFLREGEW